MTLPSPFSNGPGSASAGAPSVPQRGLSIYRHWAWRHGEREKDTEREKTEMQHKESLAQPFAEDPFSALTTG